jgi:hypothetical protein
MEIPAGPAPMIMTSGADMFTVTGDSYVRDQLLYVGSMIVNENAQKDCDVRARIYLMLFALS